MNRSWIGYDPTVPVEELFATDRGVWVLGDRADREKYAIYSHVGEVKFAVKIDGFERFGNRRAIIGEVLDDDHPIAQRWVGKPAPDRYQNPVTYFEDPAGTQRRCACGCGAEVSSGRAFLPGHDQKAIRDRIDEQWGNTERFVEWFDATYRASVPASPEIFQVPPQLRQDKYPVGDSRRTDPREYRVCTFPGHPGNRALPATAYNPATKSGNFPIRKNGTFLGWCHGCQKLSAQRHMAEPERQGVRSHKS